MQFIPLVAAMFLAGSISAVTGFGIGIVGSISLAIIVGPKGAVILLSILSCFTSITQVLKYRQAMPVVRRLTWLLAAALVGALIGAYLLVWLSYSVLAMVLGLFTLTYVAMTLAGYRPKVTPRAERVLSPLVGMLAGVANSTVGSSGPVLGTYMVALRLKQAPFVLSLSVAFFVMGVVRLVTLAALGQYTLPIVAAGLGLLVPTVAGQLVGFALQDKVPRAVFERMVLALLAISAAYLVFRGVSAA